MKKLALTALLLSSLAVITVQSAAQPGLGRDFAYDKGGFDRPGMMADMLGLTDEQEAQINELTNAAKLVSAVDRERMQQVREELRRLAESTDTFDAGTAQQLADELAEIVARTSFAGAEVRWKVRQVFTEEQLLELDAIKAERAQMRGGFGPAAGGFGPWDAGR